MSPESTTPNVSSTKTSPLFFTEMIPSSLLSKSLHLPALFKLINHSFNHPHTTGAGGILPPSTSDTARTSRLKTPNQLSHEVGPDGFTILMFSSDGPIHGEESRLIGTASAKPYVPADATGNEAAVIFKRPPPTSDENRDGWPQWEVAAMAVHPGFQGRGLASRLLELLVEEVKARTVADLQGEAHRSNVDGGEQRREGKGGKVIILLSTIQELNERYYRNRGWRTTAVQRFEPGTLGSRDGFSVVEMMRLVDL